MNGSEGRADRFERLLHQSSLGRPGARQLRERVSDADIERVRRLIDANADAGAGVATSVPGGRHLPTGRIVGRDLELTQIWRALDDTAAGVGGYTVIQGAAGSGKTRMALAAVDLAAKSALAVAHRQAFPRDLAAPLATVAQALLSCAPPAAEFAWLSQSPHANHSIAAIDRIQESLKRYAARRPLLIVIDDAHRMDELSALALDQLVPALAVSPVRWLLTVNTAHSDPPPMLERLTRHGAAPIRLSTLDDRATALLCADRLGAKPDESVLAVAASGGGNPALIEQVLAALNDTDRIRIAGGVATVVGADAPIGLSEALAGILRSRSDAEQQLVRSAAAVEQPADVSVVARMTDCTPVELRDAIDDAVAAGILARSPGGLAFRHELVRQAVLRTQDPATPRHSRERAGRSTRMGTTVAAGRPTRADPTDRSSEPAAGGGPTVRRILLGVQLRRLREAKAVALEDAGREIRASGSKISRMELGRVSFKERDVADLLMLYGVYDDGEREALLDLARQAGSQGWWQPFSDILPGWFQSYLGLEAAATLIRTYEIQFVPGLLQTPDYARAVVMLGHASVTAEELDRRVELRRQRRQLLDQPGAPQLWAVIDEAVLRRPVGGVDVMRAQIEALIQATEKPNVRLQIVPFNAGGHAAAGGPFAILRFPEPELPDVVYVEQLTSAIYLDKREDVDQYALAMARVVIDAHPPHDTAEILAKLLEEAGRID